MTSNGVCSGVGVFDMATSEGETATSTGSGGASVCSEAGIGSSLDRWDFSTWSSCVDCVSSGLRVLISREISVSGGDEVAVGEVISGAGAEVRSRLLERWDSAPGSGVVETLLVD